MRNSVTPSRRTPIVRVILPEVRASLKDQTRLVDFIPTRCVSFQVALLKIGGDQRGKNTGGIITRRVSEGLTVKLVKRHHSIPHLRFGS
jgi:hypothetical protein